MREDIKVVFMGTPEFAKCSLEKLVESKYNVVGVFTNPDKPAGRGMKLRPSAVKEYAIKNNIPVYQPAKLRNNEEVMNILKELKPDIICVVAYGKILPKEVLNFPRLGCVNVHGSLLPKYRGAAPMQWAIINGEEKTGITTMYMDEGMDTGDMILKREVEIGEDETTGELWNRLSKIGGELLVETLRQIEEGIAPRIKQGDDFSVAPMLDKEMAKIDWESKNASEIKNLVRGLNPIMGAYSFINNKKIKFWKVDTLSFKDFASKFSINIQNIENNENGTVLVSDSKKGLYIKAKDGIVDVIEIQGENAKKMNIQDFLRGNKIDFGKKFI